MDLRHFQKIKKILARALALPADEQEAYLHRVCSGEDSLLREVLDLMRFDRELEDETVLVSRTDYAARIGEQVDQYTLRDVLGEGGMGVVYPADQEKPLQRRVALKIIKLGMDTAEVVGRFESERQALAMMDHPHIAKVFAAGATADGRPYFVMEYIPGRPITEFCRRHRLGLEGRLKLFVQVCRAIHHAHQRGIIHRDLKPGNILVTGDADRPVAKVIDFGVAKATSRRLTEHTVFTQAGTMIGTPEYMSPEQADPTERDIDVRCDVYTLGVILYELMTDVLPIDRATLLEKGLIRVYQLLQEYVPPSPSTRLSRITEHGASTLPPGREQRTWVRRLRGDLDWVTMKALEKERERRYGSPAELADDLERFMRHEPVLAGPPSVRYRLGKFVRRHKTAVAAGILVVTSLLLGITGTTTGMIKAHHAQQEATAAARTSEAGRLFQLARNTKLRSRRLAILHRAVGLLDRPEYRREITRCLLEEPPFFRLPFAPDSHNAHTLDISPDGHWLVLGWSLKGSLQLYPLAGGEPLDLVGHHGCLVSTRFLAGSDRLVSAGLDSTVRVWSVPQGNLESTWRLRGVPQVAICGGDSLLIVCEAVVGEPLHWWRRPVAGGQPELLGDGGMPPESLVDLPLVAVGPEGDLAAVPQDSFLVLYGLSRLGAGTPDTLGTHSRTIVGCRFSPDGKRVCSFDNEGQVFFWDPHRPGEPPVRRLQSGVNPFGARFSDDGRLLLISSTEGFHIWDLDLPGPGLPLVLRAVGGWSFDCDLDPRRRWIITSHLGATVAAWSLNGPLRIDLDPPGGRDGCVAFSRDSRWMVTASHDGVVAAWPLSGRHIGEPRVLGEFPEHGFFRLVVDEACRYCYLTCCESPQGVGTLTRIPLAGGEARVWSGGTCYFKLDPTGRYAAFPADPTFGVPAARVLDMETGTLVHLDEPGHEAWGVGGFLADGRLLAQTRDLRLGLWSADGSYQGPLEWSGDELALAPDRKTFIVYTGDRNWLRGRLDGTTEANRTVKARFDYYNFMACDAEASHAVIGYLNGEMDVIDFTSGDRTGLPLWHEPTLPPVFDPVGRWLASWGEGKLTLLPLPLGDRHQDLPHDSYIAWLDSLTNLKMRDAEDTTQGYRIVGWDIPDWQNPPRW